MSDIAGQGDNKKAKSKFQDLKILVPDGQLKCPIGCK